MSPIRGDGGKLRPGLPEIRLDDDRVPPVDRLRLVPRHLHRHRSRYARPLKVPDGRPPLIVEKSTGRPRLPARRPPRLGHRLDRPATATEDPRNDAALGALAAPGVLQAAPSSARSGGMSGKARPYARGGGADYGRHAGPSAPLGLRARRRAGP